MHDSYLQKYSFAPDETFIFLLCKCEAGAQTQKSPNAILEYHKSGDHGDKVPDL